MSSQRIRGLDGLRACAVFMVFIAHQMKFRHAAFGDAGVYLFFILSGFLIFGILERERGEVLAGNQTARGAWIRFLIARSLRIFPIYYLAIGIVWLLNNSLTPGIIVPGELPSHLTFTTNLWIEWIGHRWTPALSHFWSLAVEEQFYLLAAPLVLFGLGTVRRVCAWFLGINLLSFVLLYATGTPSVWAYCSPFVNFGLFAMGGLLHSVDGALWKERTGNLTVMLVFGTFLGLPWIAGLWAPSFAANVVMWFGGVLMALLVFLVSLHQDCALVRLLECGPVSGFGRISYGFYVYHYILSVNTVRLITGGLVDLRDLPRSASAAILFGVTLLVSRASWDLVEAPALRWKKRLLSKGSDHGVDGQPLHGNPATTGEVRATA